MLTILTQRIREELSKLSLLDLWTYWTYGLTGLIKWGQKMIKSLPGFIANFYKSPPHIGGDHVTMSCCVKRQRRPICYFNRATCDVKVFNKRNPIILSRSSHVLVEILCKKLTTEKSSNHLLQ